MILEDLYKFFKFSMYCYNIFKIKNILIININLSFSKKVLLKNVNDFSVFLIFPSNKAFGKTKKLKKEKRSII